MAYRPAEIRKTVTHRNTYIQTHKQTDKGRLINRHPDRQTQTQTDKHRQTDRQTHRQTNSDRPIDRQTQTDR